MGKWTGRLRSARPESTDKTDETRPGPEVSSVLSVIQRAEPASRTGSVGFVGDPEPSAATPPWALPTFINGRLNVCPRHKRLLTYREFADGRCCWCHPEDRPEWGPAELTALARINDALPGSTDKTDETPDPLEAA